MHRRKLAKKQGKPIGEVNSWQSNWRKINYSNWEIKLKNRKEKLI